MINNIVIAGDSWAWCWYDVPESGLVPGDRYKNTATAIPEKILPGERTDVTYSVPTSIYELILATSGYNILNIAKTGSGNIGPISRLNCRTHDDNIETKIQIQNADLILLFRSDPVRDALLFPDRFKLPENTTLSEFTNQNEILDKEYYNAVERLAKNKKIILVGGNNKVEYQTDNPNIKIIPSILERLAPGSTQPRYRFNGSWSQRITEDWDPDLINHIYDNSQDVPEQEKWCFPDQAHVNGTGAIIIAHDIVRLIKQFENTIDKSG